MKIERNYSRLLIGACLTFGLMAGCSKKAAEGNSQGTPTETSQAVQPSVGQPQAAAPAIPTPTSAPDQQLSQSQASMKTGDYDKAATALIDLQQSTLTAQQAEALANQMRQLQGNLANAIANGDPRAKAAADKLRAAATVH